MTDPTRIYTAAMVVIGDEILSGRTKDINIGATADFDAGTAISAIGAIATVSTAVSTGTAVVISDATAISTGCATAA